MSSFVNFQGDEAFIAIYRRQMHMAEPVPGADRWS